MPVSLRVGSLNWVPVFVFAALDSVSWHWSHGPHLCLHAVYCISELRSRRKSIRQTAAADNNNNFMFDRKGGSHVWIWHLLGHLTFLKQHSCFAGNLHNYCKNGLWIKTEEEGQRHFHCLALMFDPSYRLKSRNCLIEQTDTGDGGVSVSARDVHINQAQSICSPGGVLDMLVEFR